MTDCSKAAGHLSSADIVMPNLVVIGVQKGGSTWLHYCLSDHPDVFMSKTKELNFFTKSSDKIEEGYEEYLANFFDGRGHTYRGESTPGYFWTAPSADNTSRSGYRGLATMMRAHLGTDIRLLLALRDPVDRAISAFFHHFRAGRLDPRKSLIEQGKIGGIIDIGHYRRHWENWVAEFPEDRFLVVFYDDLIQDAQAVSKAVYEQLRLRPHYAESVDQPRNKGLVREIVDGALTVSKSSGHTLNRKFFSGQLSQVTPKDGIIKVTQSDVDLLADIYSDDIAFV